MAGRAVAAGAGTDDADLLDAVLAGRAVSSVLQPIVELETGSPAGYEALARGPADHRLRTPDALYAVARRRNRLVELDVLCRGRALEAARDAGLEPPAVLFVNVEPAALGPGSIEFASASAMGLLRERGVHVVAELTERALTTDPAHLLAFAEGMRAVGCGIALDDVGAEPASLALMPLLQPDVVKLDLRMVHDLPDPMIAETMTAVTAYAQMHEVAVVAEGVETEEHEHTALSLGATHGQGWRYGRPTPPGATRPAPAAPRRPIVPRVERRRLVPESVFALVSHGRPRLQGTKRLLREISRLIERQAADMGSLAVVLATFEEAHHFGRVVRERFATMAERAALVAALGAGIPPDPAPRVRGADIAAGDPLRHEWNVVVVAPHFSVALVARDIGDDGPELDRRFDYALVYDRDTVVQAARLLLGRIGATGPP